MIYPKRLIEVDLPIRRISAHARREKSVRHGHISTLHIWWARRPLAACRAVICASLWPDPADPLCPADFIKAAKNEMQAWTTHERQELLSEESRKRFGPARTNQKAFNDVIELRHALLDFIADFANWDNSTIREYLDTSRALTQAAHEALGGAPGTRPLVVDPFAGGGAIPLEALRVGADAFASDLNPVPVLLNKVVLEHIPKYGQRLADEVRKWGGWIEGEAERELAELYPKSPDRVTPFAYLWARTIQCEGPGCGAEVPLIRSLWLVKKAKGSVAVQLAPNRGAKRVDFEIIRKEQQGWVNQANGHAYAGIPSFEGTVRRGSAACPCCGFTTPVASVRRQLSKRSGGAADARLYVVVDRGDEGANCRYRQPHKDDITAFNLAIERVATRRIEDPEAFPTELLPTSASGYFAPPTYGARTFSDLFNPRQLNFARWLIDKSQQWVQSQEFDLEAREAFVNAFALVIDRLIDSNSSQCWWVTIHGETVMRTFGRQAYPIVWDYAELNPTAVSSRGIAEAVDVVAKGLQYAATWKVSGAASVVSAAAQDLPLPDDSCAAFVTDPPYYNAIPYADLADFYTVWITRLLAASGILAATAGLSPKTDELVEMAGWDEVRYSHKSKAWYEEQMALALSRGRVVTQPNGIMVLVFAHKDTHAWEALLSAVISAGWTITSSWPINTENARRLRAQASATLDSSVHLVGRPRENPDGSLRADNIGDWSDVLQELPRRIHEWMPRLAEEGVVGADAIFACLGPALEVFSRYSRVEKSNGDPVRLKDYLEHVWAAVSKEALSVIFEGANTEGFEADARLTAMWLWTLAGPAKDPKAADAEEDDDADEDDDAPKKGKKKSGFTLEYDAARKIAQGLGAHLDDLKNMVEVSGETARLLPVAERTAYLFGKEQAEEPVAAKRKKKRDVQPDLFSELAQEGVSEKVWIEKTVSKIGETTLDRIHQSMILFAASRSEALKRFLLDDGAGRDQRFWRLAQALSALYPPKCEEKRWVDGVLARKKGLGL
jgi:putative DNA methylase